MPNIFTKLIDKISGTFSSEPDTSSFPPGVEAALTPGTFPRGGPTIINLSGNRFLLQMPGTDKQGREYELAQAIPQPNTIDIYFDLLMFAARRAGAVTFNDIKNNATIRNNMATYLASIVNAVGG